MLSGLMKGGTVRDTLRTRSVGLFFLLVIIAPAWTQDSGPVEDWIYSVKPGDNPWSITERFLDGMKYWPLVQKHNAIGDPLHIPVDSKLRIPISWIRTAPGNAVLSAAPFGGCLAVGENNSIRNLSQGDSLVAGVRLRTSADGFCTLRFPDGSRLLLLADSELSLDKLLVYAMTGMFDIRTTVHKGRVEVSAQKATGPASRFEISTPQGVTSVRGTRFRNASESATGRAEVLDGRVEVKNPFGAVVLDEGTGSLFSNNAAPLPPIPLLLAPDLSQVSREVRRIPQTVHFAPIPGASAYRAQWARDQSFAYLIADIKFTTPEFTLVDLPDGTYALRVRAIDEHGLEGKEAELAFKVERMLPSPQGCSSPGGVEFEQSEVTFECTPLSEATKYRFQIARDDRFEQMSEDWIQNEPRLRVRLAALGKYYWRVAAMDAKFKVGDYSEVSHIVRTDIAPRLELLELGRTAMTLGWSPHRVGKRYRLQFAADNNFSSVLSDITTAGDRLVLSLPLAGTYYARVGVLSSAETGVSFGPVRELKLPAVGSRFWLAPLGLGLILGL